MAGIAPINTLVFNPADYINTSATAQTKTGDLALAGTGTRRLSIGDNGSGNGAVRLFGASSQYGWQVGSNITIANALEFAPATAIGGTTFGPPTVALNANGSVVIGADPGGSELLRVGGKARIDGLADSDALQINSGNALGSYLTLRNSGAACGLIGSASALAGGALADLAIRATQNLIIAPNAGVKSAVFDSSGALVLGTSDPGGSELLRGTGGFRFTADSILTSATDATSTTSAALIISGGIGWGATKTSYGGGLLLVSPTIGLGYATGAGGTVTQSTSKSTGVTLDKVCGTITMNAASLAADTSVSFALTNSAIAENDYIDVQHDSVGTLGAYNCVATPAAGSATITVRNVTPGALAQAIVLRFFVNKAAVA